MLGLAGVTAIDFGVSTVTVTDALPLMVPVLPPLLTDAMMVADPEATAVASPLAFTVMMLVFELAHVAVLVTFAVVPSL
jgi:hypothetical protein